MAPTAECERCPIHAGLLAARLDGDEMRRLCERLGLNRVRAGQVLFREGDRATHLYVVREGGIKLLRRDACGGEHVVALLGPGDLAGVEALFRGTCASTAEAVGDGAVCVASREEMDGLLRRAPDLAVELVRSTQTMLDRAFGQQACLGVVGSVSRVAAYLLHLAGGEDGAAVVPNPITQAELGAIVGVSAETACRALTRLRERGLIEVGNEEIRIEDRMGLLRAVRC